MTTHQKQVSDMIIAEGQKGNVVFLGVEGLRVAAIDDFIAQPTEGILYDLNRSPEVVLTFIDDPKWVNDYAVSMVIKRLKEMLELMP